MPKIKVPDIEAPVKELCWKQDPKTLARCDRQKHSALIAHTWEMMRKTDCKRVKND